MRGVQNAILGGFETWSFSSAVSAIIIQILLYAVFLNISKSKEIVVEKMTDILCIQVSYVTWWFVQFAF